MIQVNGKSLTGVFGCVGKMTETLLTRSAVFLFHKKKSHRGGIFKQAYFAGSVGFVSIGVVSTVVEALGVTGVVGVGFGSSYIIFLSL